MTLSKTKIVLFIFVIVIFNFYEENLEILKIILESNTFLIYKYLFDRTPYIFRYNFGYITVINIL